MKEQEEYENGYLMTAMERSEGVCLLYFISFLK